MGFDEMSSPLGSSRLVNPRILMLLLEMTDQNNRLHVGLGYQKKLNEFGASYGFAGAFLTQKLVNRPGTKELSFDFDA
jgi:hypothetical protein